MRHGSVLFAVVVLLSSAVFPVGAAAAGSAAVQDQTTLTVSVVSQGGAQLGGVTIVATWEGGESTATTASNGKAFVDVPRGADVNLTISSDRFIRNAPVTVEDASAQEVTVEVARRGSVTVATTSTEGPVENVSVRLLRDGEAVVSGQTDAEGTFSSGVLEQGQYTLVAEKRGYYTNRTEFRIDSEDDREELPMRAGSIPVEVRVLDDHFDDPRPVNNATVRFGDVGTSRTTSGTAVFAVPVNTDHVVGVNKPGYDSARRRYSAEESPDRIRLNIQREPALVLDPVNERVVVGESTTVTVVDEYDNPVANATVSIDGEDVARTDADGEARITIERSGNLTVRASTDDVESPGVTVIGVAVDGGTATASTTAPSTATATPSSTPVPTTTAVSLPGFGPAVAALGVVLAALLLARRE